MFSLYLFHSINRWLTLYITFSRARVVCHSRGGKRPTSRTDKNILRETLLFGVGGGVLYHFFGISLMQLIERLALHHDAFSLMRIVVCIPLIAGMLVLTLAILFETRKSKFIDRGSREKARGLHNLVIVAALVFCSCQVAWIAQHGVEVFYPSGQGYLIARKYYLDVLSVFLDIFNFTINFIAYLCFSKRFRDGFLSLLKFT